MATKDESKEAKSTKATNPADEAILKKGELTGQARGPDVDGSFHVYEFEDAESEESK